MAEADDGSSQSLLGERARGDRTLTDGEDARKLKPKEPFPWYRWNPFDSKFYRYHFGTDFLVGSWLFVLSSAMWVGMEADDIATEHVHRFAVAFNHVCTMVCAILFLLGSCYFVYMSYPEEMARMMAQISHEDVSQLSWAQRYFTGRYTRVTRCCTHPNRETSRPAPSICSSSVIC